MARTITWLHLSDLHFCETRTGWDAQCILDKLLEDLREMSKRSGPSLQPDFIFFTGDLAYGHLGGGKQSLSRQLDGAHKLLERIRRSYRPSIPRRNVFLVPGNHD